MTPEHLTGLAVLVLEFAHWLEQERPGSLDVALATALVDVIGQERRRLVEGGAR